MRRCAFGGGSRRDRSSRNVSPSGSMPGGFVLRLRVLEVRLDGVAHRAPEIAFVRYVGLDHGHPWPSATHATSARATPARRGAHRTPWLTEVAAQLEVRVRPLLEGPGRAS